MTLVGNKQDQNHFHFYRKEITFAFFFFAFLVRKHTFLHKHIFDPFRAALSSALYTGQNVNRAGLKALGLIRCSRNLKFNFI